MNAPALPASSKAAVIADGHLHLSATLGAKRPGAHTMAVLAIAIPLRKATSRGGAQDCNPHCGCLQLRGRVGVDFAVQANLFKLGARPFHGSILHWFA